MSEVWESVPGVELSDITVCEDLLTRMEKEPDNVTYYEYLVQLLPQIRVQSSEGRAYADSKMVLVKQKTYELALSTGAQAFYDAYISALKAEARYNFDSYLLFVESRREPDKKFYVPRRRVLFPVVQAMQDLVDDKLDLLTVSMPPGVGKTTLGTFFLSWVMGRSPDAFNLASGHSAHISEMLYRGVLSIITDGEYRWKEVFPRTPIVRTSAQSTAIDLLHKSTFPTLTCRSVDGSQTGVTRVNNILYIDDLVSGSEEALSKPRLDKLWSKYTSDIRSRGIGDCVKEIHVATRWSVHDPIGRLERRYKGSERARFIVLPALDGKGESNFDFPYGLGYTTEKLLDLKAAMDDVSWKCLYMNEPIEREGLLYVPDELNRYYSLPSDEPEQTLAVLDPAEGGGDDVVLLIASNYGGKAWYITDCVVSNAAPTVTDELVVSCLLRNPVDLLRVESNGAGWRTADKIEEQLRKNNKRTMVTKKRTTANKETKILVCSTEVKQNFYFKDVTSYPRGSMYADLMDKLCSYSLVGRNKHDDVPDAMAMMVQLIDSRTKNEVTVMERFM